MSRQGVDGRPVRREPEEKRQRLIEAATTIFARLGPAAARVDDVAAEAEVNKQLIYHYFRSKDGLFEAVIDAFAERFDAAAEALRGARHPLADMFSNMHADEAFTRLMTWEGLHVGHQEVTREARRATQLREAAAALSPHAPAEQAAHRLITFLGAAVFARVFPHFARMLTGQRIDSARFVLARRRHLTELGETLADGPLGRLAYLYVGTRRFDEDVVWYEDGLGSQRVWAFEKFGAKVAAFQLGNGPLTLLADHRRPEGPLPLYAVHSLVEAQARLSSRGLKPSREVATPTGPASLWDSPGGSTLGLLEERRPEALNDAWANPSHQPAIRKGKR
jgi:AcrR family transcriptional regulator